MKTIKRRKASKLLEYNLNSGLQHIGKPYKTTEQMFFEFEIETGNTIINA